MPIRQGPHGATAMMALTLRYSHGLDPDGRRSALVAHDDALPLAAGEVPAGNLGVYQDQDPCKALQCLATSQVKRTRQARHCKANDPSRPRHYS